MSDLIPISQDEFFYVLMANIRFRMGDLGFVDIPLHEMTTSNFICATRVLRARDGALLGYRFSISPEEVEIENLIKELA